MDSHPGYQSHQAREQGKESPNVDFTVDANSFSAGWRGLLTQPHKQSDRAAKPRAGRVQVMRS
jgi:hypothetical protein